MNRLRTPAAAPSSKQPAKFSSLDLRFDSYIEEGRSTALGGESPAALIAPMHYEPNYAYPLVVWLHGNNQDERQLVRLMPQVSLRNYVGVAPRGPMSTPTSRGYSWDAGELDAADAEKRVWDAIDEARRRYHVAKRRIFLAGTEAGGTAALRLALAHPDRFAGALSFGGPFPGDGTPLMRLAEIRRLPLFLAYDRNAADFSPAQIDRQMRLFFTAGMQVMLRQYPPQSLLGKQMLADADRWMMNLVTGSNE
jgi:phospholipase/carboxylesterase